MMMMMMTPLGKTVGNIFATVFFTTAPDCYSYNMVQNIAEEFNPLTMLHQRYRQTTDGIAMPIVEPNVVTFG